MYCKILILIVIVVGLMSTTVKAQYAISTKAVVGGLDLGSLTESNESSDEAGELMKPSAGVMIGFERYIGSRTYSVKLRQGIVSRFDDGFRSFTQFNLRYRLFHRKHALSFSMGPSLFAKPLSENTDSEYTEAANFQYRIVWFSGEIEYEYYLNSQLRAAFSLNHVEPSTVALAAGVKFFFKSKAKKCDCPSFNKY